MKKNPPKHPDYKAPKSGPRKVNHPRGKGWIDNKGRIWIPEDHKGNEAPHYDRQNPKGGGYTKIYPYSKPSFNITPEDILRGALILGGAAIIVFDVVTIPSGEGMLGIEMIRRAIAP